MIDLYFQHFTNLSILLFLTVGTLVAFRAKSPSLDIVLPPGLSSATIPTGLALILCAFSPNYVEKLSDFSLYVAVAGFVLILFAYNSIKKAIDDTR